MTGSGKRSGCPFSKPVLTMLSERSRTTDEITTALFSDERYVGATQPGGWAHRIASGVLHKLRHRGKISYDHTRGVWFERVRWFY